MCTLSESKLYVAIALATLISTSVPLSGTRQTAAQGIGTRDFLESAPGDFLSPVHITGEVKKPGTFPVIDSPTLAQVLGMAGGLTGNAGPTAILVHFSDDVPLAPLSRASLAQMIRPGSTAPLNVVLTRIVLTGNWDRQMQLAPQDILFVPSKNES